MKFIRIKIINSKAKLLIKYLADKGLIKIKKEQMKYEFFKLLDRFKNQSKNAPSLDEINKEIVSIRKAQNENLSLGHIISISKLISSSFYYI